MFTKLKNKWCNVPLTVKVSISYAICSILQRSLSFITLPLFTRLLTTDQYGQYTVYLSWFDIIAIFITLNLAYGSFSTAMIKFEDRREEYISSIEGICLLLAGVFLLLYLPFYNLWKVLIDLPAFLVILMIVEIIMQTSIQLWSGKKRYEFKYKSVIAVTLLSSVISPILAYIFVINTEEKGYARIMGYALTTILFGGCIFILNIRKGKKLFNKEFWKYAFGFNIPLLAYYLSQVIFNQSDRIMINYYCGTDKAAIYGVAYTLAMVLTFVLNAINNSYLPWFYRKLKEGKQSENKKISCAIAVLMAVLLLGVIWFAPEIIYILAGSEYYEAIWVVPPVAISMLLIFYTQLFVGVEFYHEEKKSLIGASVGAAIINIILNILLIPRLGFIAAGYTTLVSYMMFAVANYFAMKKILKKRNISETGYDIKMLVTIFVVFVLLVLLGVRLYNLLIVRVIITIIVLMIIFALRHKLWEYTKWIKE